MLLDQIEQLNELSPQEQEAVLGDIEWELCKADPLYWMRNYGWMRNKREGIITGPGIDLWPDQEQYFLDILAGVSQIVGKSRRVGCSSIWTLADLYDMLFGENVDLGCIAQDEDAGSDFHLDYLKWAYWLQPHYLRRFDPIKGKQRDNLTKFQLTNGCNFSAYPCSSSSARGGGYKRIRLEEFAHWPSRLQMKVWASVVGGSGDTGGQVGIVSTANGEGDKYHELWKQAEAGELDLKPVFFSCWTVPGRDQAWYDREAAKLKADMMQEHPRSPREMFIASGKKYFDLEKLTELEARHGRKPIRLAMSEELSIWVEPVEGRRYAIGADVSDGGGDGCCADVYDADSGEQVAQFLSYQCKADSFGDVLFDLGRMYHMALIGGEINNSGLTSLTVLKRRGYPRLFKRRDEVEDKDPELWWLTNDNTRPLLLGDYRGAIEDAGGLIVHSEASYQQAREFGKYKGRWDHPPNGHDDSVFSGGIAWQVVKRLRETPPSQQVEILIGGKRVV